MPRAAAFMSGNGLALTLRERRVDEDGEVCLCVLLSKHFSSITNVYESLPSTTDLCGIFTIVFIGL